MSEPGLDRGEAYCCEPDCGNLAARGGRCWGHVKQLQRHGRTSPLAERPATPLDRLEGAAHELGDAIVTRLLDPRDQLEQAVFELGRAADRPHRDYLLARRRFWEAYRAAVQAELAAVNPPEQPQRGTDRPGGEPR